MALIKIHGAEQRPVACQTGAKRRRVHRLGMPYILLVIFVLLWGYAPMQKWLDHFSLIVHWPGLPPKAAPYKFGWASAAGTACLLASLFGSLAVVGLTPMRFLRVLGRTFKQLALAELTLAAVLALAYLMNHSGATTTLGLAFATTGVLFPFAGALLGWLRGVPRESDTSAQCALRESYSGNGAQAGDECRC